MKYRKIFEVEAVQWNGLYDDKYPDWLKKPIKDEKFGVKYDKNNRCFFYVETLEGNHKFMMYDWVIKGVNGELYPCKDKIFKKTYKEVK